MAGPRPTVRRRQTRFERYRRRITCDLIIEGKRHSAIVTDLSASGLYVRTQETPEPGASVRVILHEVDGEIELDAKVVREHRMSRHHTTGTPSGLGLKIVSAPECFFQLLIQL